MVNNSSNIRRTAAAQRHVHQHRRVEAAPGIGPVPLPTPEVDSNNCSCCDMLCAIMEAHFFATDLKLYLDTHPDDKRALEMYTEACKQYKACKAAFEDSCYPLTACSAGQNGCWDWPEGVWPPKN